MLMPSPDLAPRPVRTLNLLPHYRDTRFGRVTARHNGIANGRRAANLSNQKMKGGHRARPPTAAAASAAQNKRIVDFGLGREGKWKEELLVWAAGWRLPINCPGPCRQRNCFIDPADV